MHGLRSNPASLTTIHGARSHAPPTGIDGCATAASASSKGRSWAVPTSTPTPNTRASSLRWKEIEGWTLRREKVLVFGVFLRPLRFLRDVLNVRHALRAADAGRPIAHAIHTYAALLGIALRQLERLRSEGSLSGRLSTGNVAEMRRSLAESHKADERLRDKVRRRAKKPVAAWRTDPSLFGGASVDRELRGALEDHLVSFSASSKPR